MIVHIVEGDEDATEELESVIMDEPDQLLHLAQLLRDRRESARTHRAEQGKLRPEQRA